MAAHADAARRAALARLDQMADADLTHATWVSNRDETVCPDCRALDGRMLTLAEARALIEANPCTATDDGYPAPCRCGLRPIVPP